jgi:hypothetical protein
MTIPAGELLADCGEFRLSFSPETRPADDTAPRL